MLTMVAKYVNHIVENRYGKPWNMNFIKKDQSVDLYSQKVVMPDVVFDDSNTLDYIHCYLNKSKDTGLYVVTLRIVHLVKV